MSQFITTTSLLNMRPVGSAADRSLPRMEGILEREFKGRLSLRLAEPVERNDRTGVDWYVDSDDAVTQLTTIPPELADYYRRRLQADVSVIASAAAGYESRSGQAAQNTASALRNAIQFPGDDNIWLLGDVSSGKAAIVLTAWGYEPQTSELAGGRGDAIKRPVKVLPEPGQVLISQNDDEPTPQDVGGKPAARNWLGILSSGLWAVALVLSFVIGWFLLPACGIRVPFTDRYLYGWGDGAFCRQLPNPQMEASRRQSDVLTAELGSLAEQVKVKIATCIPAPPPDPVNEVRERTRVEGVDLNPNETTVSLVWNNTNDLDLIVVCPNGERIFHGNKKACGGELEIDKNYQTYSQEPIEHVRFGERSLMPGRYGIEVKYYGVNGGQAPGTTPFKVVVQQKGKEPIVQSGSVQSINDTKLLEFTVP
ncbi:hypothetical protein QN224_26005 [Sinorhizobium sp. 8-89]|uniref:hypothetical protein n=1 Tax=Sinorhizobium sp. 7-81 TaxID=3049087 RepID=UPI0024C28AC1|nr:hypothetical protein [Sinorhizobium sp. 7-81]MDK1388859.1 hypothetical protein [Sinorhizobium sp. 7-81]